MYGSIREWFYLGIGFNKDVIILGRQGAIVQIKN
jgi:hypothetical protein